MRYQATSQDLFINNRRDFFNNIPENSVAIFNSNDIMPTNADGVFPFKQNSDLFYLSGIDQEETILLLYKGEKNKFEVLFTLETNEHLKIWEGAKFDKAASKTLSGIDQIFWTHEFEAFLKQLTEEHKVERVYLNTNQHARAKKEVETRDDRFKKWFEDKYSKYSIDHASSIMHELRQVKSLHEITQIKRACEITRDAFLRVLKFTRPGVFEFEIEAEITHEFIRQGSRGHAYQPIVASGEDACVLHYIGNDKKCEDGDLILMDFGAEYGNYNADLTRTIPSNGRFTPRQLEVYKATLRVQREAVKMLRPGNNIKEYHEEVGKIMTEELIGLGLLTKKDVSDQDAEKPAYRRYFMHGTSHSLGLDVHDVDNRDRAFENNMVFTCEPGIYIPEEGIGVRLENDIVINDNTPIDLMQDIPIEPEEIEHLMNQEL